MRANYKNVEAAKRSENSIRGLIELDKLALVASASEPDDEETMARELLDSLRLQIVDTELRIEMNINVPAPFNADGNSYLSTLPHWLNLNSNASQREIEPNVESQVLSFGCYGKNAEFRVRNVQLTLLGNSISGLDETPVLPINLLVVPGQGISTDPKNLDFSLPIPVATKSKTIVAERKQDDSSTQVR